MKPNKFLVILPLSVFGALLTGFFYVYDQGIWLPPTDDAYGIGFFKTLQDPFVLNGAVLTSVLIGIGASPMLYYLLKLKNLKFAYPVIQLSVMASIAVLTPLGFIAISGSCVALLFSAILFRVSSWANNDDQDEQVRATKIHCLKLMTVLIVLILLSIFAAPKLFQLLQKSRDGATKENLASLIAASNAYAADHVYHAPNLVELIPDYLKQIPDDGQTGSSRETPKWDGTGGWVYVSFTGQVDSNLPMDKRYHFFL
jgi:hypothetical protein